MARFTFLFCLVLSCNTAHGAEMAQWVWPHAFARASQAKGEIYLLQKHFPKNGRAMGRGPSPHLWKDAQIHLVFRLEREPQVNEVVTAFLVLKNAWESEGTKIAGLQLDYDSPTAKLGSYVHTLEEIRSSLPADMAVSVTGLPDWLRVDPWKHSKGITVFYQLYRGKKAQPHLDVYLAAAKKSSTPFRIGLFETQHLTASQEILLSQNKNYQGAVVFLGEKK